MFWHFCCPTAGTGWKNIDWTNFVIDGVISMMAHHTGLNKAFFGEKYYFDASVDEDALTYRSLVNTRIDDINF